MTLVGSQKINQIANRGVQLLFAFAGFQLAWSHVYDFTDQTCVRFLNGTAVVQPNYSCLGNQFDSEIVKEGEHAARQVGCGDVLVPVGFKVRLPRSQKGEQVDFAPVLASAISEEVGNKSTGNRPADTPKTDNNKHFLNGIPVHLRLLILAVSALIGGLLGGFIGALGYFGIIKGVDLVISILNRQQHRWTLYDIYCLMSWS